MDSPEQKPDQTKGGHALARAAFLWGPPALYMLLILAASLVPIGKTPAVWKHQDKIAHFVEYAVLSALLFRAFLPMLKPVLSMAACIAASALVGGAVELIQPYFGRTADFWDFMANSAGAVFAAFLAASAGLLRRGTREQ